VKESLPDHNLLNKIRATLLSIFDEPALQTIARSTKFIQRSTNRLCLKEFLTMLTLHVAENPCLALSGMCNIMYKMNNKIDLSYQALSAKLHLNSIECG